MSVCISCLLLGGVMSCLLPRISIFTFGFVLKNATSNLNELTFAQAIHPVLCFRHTQHVTLFVCKQAAAAPFISAKVQFTGCKDDLHQSSGPFTSLDSSENDDQLARWNSAAQPAADTQCPEVATSSCCYMMVVQWLVLQLLLGNHYGSRIKQ